MPKTKVTQSTGISFFSLLTILFVALKLTSVISWSWRWVLAPLWLPITAVLTVIAVVGIIAGLVYVTTGR